MRVQIQNNRKQEAEINERISTAMKMYYTLNIDFLKKRAFTKKTKANVYKRFSAQSLHENWVLTKDIRSRIKAAEIEYLRRIKGIMREYRVRSEVVRQELKVKPTLKKIINNNLSGSVI